MSLENNRIKHIEAQQLNYYWQTLDPKVRLWFKMLVVKRANVKPHTFNNWLHMACRIPDHAKKVIVEVAGENIFDPKRQVIFFN